MVFSYFNSWADFNILFLIGNYRIISLYASTSSCTLECLWLTYLNLSVSVSYKIIHIHFSKFFAYYSSKIFNFDYELLKIITSQFPFIIFS